MNNFSDDFSGSFSDKPNASTNEANRRRRQEKREAEKAARAEARDEEAQDILRKIGSAAEGSTDPLMKRLPTLVEQGIALVKHEYKRYTRLSVLMWAGVAMAFAGLLANGVGTFFVANLESGSDMYRSAFLLTWLSGAVAFAGLMTGAICGIIRRR